MTRAEQLASDIDAVLHAGQRDEPRYRKLIPLIEDAFTAEREDEAEACAVYYARHPA
jgi:hypothetical protein